LEEEVSHQSLPSDAAADRHKKPNRTKKLVLLCFCGKKTAGYMACNKHFVEKKLTSL
jgi:hypothetical protein